MLTLCCISLVSLGFDQLSCLSVLLEKNHLYDNDGDITNMLTGYVQLLKSLMWLHGSSAQSIYMQTKFYAVYCEAVLGFSCSLLSRNQALLIIYRSTNGNEYARECLCVNVSYKSPTPVCSPRYEASLHHSSTRSKKIIESGSVIVDRAQCILLLKKCASRVEAGFLYTSHIIVRIRASVKAFDI